jgi:hypothetical protein
MQSSELLGQLNPRHHAKSRRQRQGLMFRHEDLDGPIVAVRSSHRGQCDSQHRCELAVDTQLTQRPLSPTTNLGHLEDGSLVLHLEQKHLRSRHST